MGLLDQIRRGTRAPSGTALVVAGRATSLAENSAWGAAGEDPLAAVRDLLDQTGRIAVDELAELVRERPQPTGSCEGHALLGGIAEHLAATRVARPAWTEDPDRFRARPRAPGCTRAGFPRFPGARATTTLHRVAPAPPQANATTGSADEPQRTAILDELRREPTGLDVSQLAVRIGLHPNTIRWHLGRLADAGLVRSTPAHRGRPGRPRIVYSATSGAAPAGESYRFLAELLASALARATEGQEAVEAAGRAWGGYLVERPAPSMPLTTDEAAGRIVDLLQAHGFAPRRVGDAIEMHRCPFQELVETYGNVVCGLHRGLLGGALDALDAGVELTMFEPYPEPGLCRATLGTA